MKSFKYSAFKALLFVFAAALIVSFFSKASFAAFYCPLGYSYSQKVQLCVGNGGLKGYNAIPATKINVFEGKNHVYICPSKYAYSKKIQLCTGEGSLKGSTAQPAVKAVKAIIPLKALKKTIEKSKTNLKIIKKS